MTVFKHNFLHERVLRNHLASSISHSALHTALQVFSVVMTITLYFTICSRLLEAVSPFLFNFFSGVTGVSNVRLNRAMPKQDSKLLWLFSVQF